LPAKHIPKNKTIINYEVHQLDEDENMALKKGSNTTVKEFLNDESILEIATEDAFKIKLLLNGKVLGYVAFDEDESGDGFGCISSEKEASHFVPAYTPGDHRMYLKSGDKYLTHAMKDERLVKYELAAATGFNKKTAANGLSNLTSDYTEESLSIRNAQDTKLYVYNNYIVLDIEMIPLDD
jgi:hypothetical protein